MKCICTITLLLCTALFAQQKGTFTDTRDDKIILLYKIQDLLVALPKKKENITMKSTFGLWKNRDINEKDLRKKAWKQK